MKKIAFVLAALTLTSAAFATQALAGTHSAHANHGSNVSHSRTSSYHINHGTRFAHGYYYSGRSHNHWTFTRYDSRYGCSVYYDSGCSCWYYWCEPASCYYPVTYCPYRTYAWSSGGCSSGRVGVRLAEPGVQFPGPISRGNVSGPTGPTGPGGPGISNGPTGTGLNGPSGPGSNGPTGPGPNGSQGDGPVPNGPPPIPAPSNP